MKEDKKITAAEVQLTDEERKLQYEIAKKNIEMAAYNGKADIRLVNDLKKAAELLIMHEELEIRRELQYLEIRLGKTGRLELHIIRDEYSTSKKRIAIADEYISSCCYVCRYPKTEAILAVTFKQYGIERTITFPLSNENDAPIGLIKRLEKNGIRFIAPRRQYNDAASALFDYIIHDASIISIPFKSGYCTDENGAWKLTKPDMLTFKEVK